MNRRQTGHSAHSRRADGPVSLGLVALLTMALALVVAVPNAAATPPSPPVPLPPELDIIDGYEGQSLCDPTPKPGTLSLRDSLWRAYGSGIWAGISRDCNVSWDQGISEHKDGRAIDWGVNVRNGTRAYGDEFVRWATANNGANARRLGIMYIIWDSEMWRLYDMSRGWAEYRQCKSVYTTSSYDTTCHRDHIHISMTWHGAGAWTSWYDGSAVTQHACRAGSPIGVNPGSAASPSVLFDPLAGVGVANGRSCYLGKSIQTVKVPPVNGEESLQRVRITHTRTNAPSPVKIWTSAGSSISLTSSAGYPQEHALTVGSDGLIYIQQPIGQAEIRVQGLGISEVPGKCSAEASPALAAALQQFAATRDAMPADRQRLDSGSSRAAGVNRFATAAELALLANAQYREQSGQNVPVVFLATGWNFPDALAAGASGIPILLTRTHRLDDEARAALQEIRPASVVVVGGPTVVSPNVEAEAHAATGAGVERICGSNRYGTAAAIASALGSIIDSSTVYLATGEDFPDALAAGPVAASSGAPVLLTRKDSLPAETKSALTALSPRTIVVLGGTETVSDSVMAAGGAMAAEGARRIAGVNRYETATAVAAQEYAPGQTAAVVIATGENFPDALAAGPAAWWLGGPVFLTKQQCAPSTAVDWLTTLAPPTSVVAGGTTTVADGAWQRAC